MNVRLRTLGPRSELLFQLETTFAVDEKGDRRKHFVLPLSAMINDISNYLLTSILLLRNFIRLFLPVLSTISSSENLQYINCTSRYKIVKQSYGMTVKHFNLVRM